MTHNPLSLFCLVDGEATSNAFPVVIKPTKTKTIGDLKELIKAKKPNRFHDVDADELTLWSVTIADSDDMTPILIDKVPKTEKKKRRATTQVSVFGAALPEDTIHVIVQRPPPATKREREHDAGPSSMCLRVHTLLDAIAEAGFTEKAVVNGWSNISRLDFKERVLLLGFVGQDIGRTDTFSSLSRTAIKLHGSNISNMDKLSVPDGTLFPVVGTNELFIRRAYRDLHDTILGTFDNARPGNQTQKHIVVTGTSGISNSAFLVYFAICLLAESDDDNPPIIVFHTKRRKECYAFGGLSTVRFDSIEDFEPFLSLPDTWYFVDRSPDPILHRAKTVISASQKNPIL
ncbi:hypothetical protein BGW42_008158 [Actinomortierella wolfii]|nr:hypothetical protein BGW42_008158 [Actinomortierella wolfii]